LAKSEYIIRRDKVCAHIYINKYARNEASKQQKTGTDTYMRLYVNTKIEEYSRLSRQTERFWTIGQM